VRFIKMGIPEEIKQVLVKHTLNTDNGGEDVIPAYEMDDIIVEVLGVLQARGSYYPQSRTLGGGWWVFIPEGGLPGRSTS
jgi:hypothetical protein